MSTNKYAPAPYFYSKNGFVNCEHVMFMAKETGKKVAVVDASGIVMPYLTDTETIDYTDYSSCMFLDLFYIFLLEFGDKWRD